MDLGCHGKHAKQETKLEQNNLLSHKTIIFLVNFLRKIILSMANRHTFHRQDILSLEIESIYFSKNPVVSKLATLKNLMQAKGLEEKMQFHEKIIS